MISYIVLFLSICLNLLLFWYIRQVLVSHRDLGEFTIGILDDLRKFEEHLKTVYELERFYGDSTLSGLLEHTNDLSNTMKQYREFFVLQLDDEYEEELEEEQ
jgi:hypothetical protein